MGNILITSFGNGSFDKETKRYDYSIASYFDVASGRTAGQQRLIIPAMHELYQIDKTILIGTAGSNWPLLYKEVMAKRSGFVPKSRVRNEEYYKRLNEYHRRSQTERININEMQDVLAELQEELGDAYPTICLLEYGITPEEQWYNYSALVKATLANIVDGDAIFFDITHAFRTLPMYALLVLKFIQQQRKDVAVEMISYGMFDAKALYEGKTPLTDVSPIAEMVEWISSLIEYNTTGTAYQLLALLEKDTLISSQIREELRGSATALRMLGEAVAANDIAAFGDLVREITHIENNPHSLVNISDNLGAVRLIFSGISGHFANGCEDNVALHFLVAAWHMKYGRNMQAAITLGGAILLWLENALSRHGIDTGFGSEAKRNSFIMEVIGSFNKKVNPIQEKKSFSEFNQNFFAAREIRNAFAHSEGRSFESRDIEMLPGLVAYFTGLYLDGDRAAARGLIEDTLAKRAGEIYADYY